MRVFVFLLVSLVSAAAVQAYHENFKSKNCRTFYQTKQCMYGTTCMFRHEHRSFKQLHRHYYTPNLNIFEMLFTTAPSKRVFLKAYKPSTARLEVFANIHDMYDAEHAEEQEATESELSEIEVVSEAAGLDLELCEGKSPLGDSNATSFLNTTGDSGIEDFPQSKFAPNCFYSPCSLPLDSSDSEKNDESDQEDLDLSPQSFGLDFV